MSKVKEGNYIVIQSFMVSQLKLKGNELLVYAIIYGFSQTDNQVFTGSLQYLADWTNATKQGVTKNLKALIEKGLIKKNERFINGVKFCEYYATKFNTPLNIVAYPIKHSLTNNIENKIEDNNSYLSEFQVVWSEYPRKISKQLAYKAYEKARKSGVDYETILQGVIRYRNYIESNNTDEKYIKHGSTWFNQRCWEDEYSDDKTQKRKENQSYSFNIDELDVIR